MGGRSGKVDCYPPEANDDGYIQLAIARSAYVLEVVYLTSRLEPARYVSRYLSSRDRSLTYT
jgi:hypothetical protein